MLKYSEIAECENRLKSWWQPETERVGVILPSLDIVEVQNLADDPTDNFRIKEEDLKGAVATWHTHPSGHPNLSISDYYFFRHWSDLAHFILGSTKSRCYVVSNNHVFQVDEEADYPPRPSG